MPVLHIVHPRATDSDTPSILQHFYVIALIVILVGLFVLRIIVLRRRNKGLSDFFRLSRDSPHSYGSYPPYNSSHGSMIHGIQLARPAAVYHPDRRVHAADVDVHGRRLDPGGEEWEGKETLPAYDSRDRPPKYVEAGWSQRSPPPAVGEQSAAVPQNTINGVSRDTISQPVDDTHAVVGVAHESNILPAPPVHDDLSHC